MTLYRKVDPALWDDERFLELSDDAQSIWLLLLTGPQTCSIPGLQVADVYTLSSVRRWQPDRVTAALAEITAAGMAQVDFRYRVVRLPNGMKRNSPENVNVLKGLYRQWRLLPPSPLKWLHIASIEESIDFSDEKTGAAMMAGWDVTFGKEERSKPSRNGSETVSEQPARQLSDCSETVSNSVISDQEAVNSEQEEDSAPPPAAPLILETQDVAKKAKRPRKPKTKPEEPPPPFKLEDGLAELASGGRFVATPLDVGQTINAYKLVRANPDIGDWKLAGEWLAAGGDGWMDLVDSRNLSGLPAWIAHARQWREKGRRPIAVRGNGANGKTAVHHRPREAIPAGQRPEFDLDDPAQEGKTK